MWNVSVMELFIIRAHVEQEDGNRTNTFLSGYRLRIWPPPDGVGDMLQNFGPVGTGFLTSSSDLAWMRETRGS